MSGKVAYPYIPDGWTIEYVHRSYPAMARARNFARTNSLDKTMPGAAVIVLDGVEQGIGANGSKYHEEHGCERVRLGCKSGQGYELCEGCSPKNHSEAKAIAAAKALGNNTLGATLYLWGHWWCCRDCWDAIITAGIARVVLMENSEVLFNKDNPGNVVGKQFELA